MGERNIDQSIGFGVTGNTYSAHSKFSEITQAEKMVDRTGKLVGESSSNAQIRTLLDEQRQMIIAAYCEKIGHHELQAARAEEERRILQEELWRQQKDFREDDGAIEFYKIKFYLRNHHSQIQNWSDDRWKVCLAAGVGSKRRYQYCSDNSGVILYLRALQGHSGSNLIDPTLQDNVVIGTGIFLYIYHVGCAFNLHSMINNGLIPGGQNLR